MKKGICEKCGNDFWLEEHHVPPRASNSSNKITYSLCPNCHTDFHLFLGKKNLKNNSTKYHLKIFYMWLLGVAITTILFYMKII